MYQAKITHLKKDKVTHYQIQNKLTHQLLSFQEVVDNWMNNKEFCIYYTQLLVENPFLAFFWEHPPMTKNSLQAPYEFVLVNSTSLPNVTAEPQTFASHFQPNQTVVAFPNLSGDAQLIVPIPKNESTDYAHFAKFILQATDNQLYDFWKMLGEVYQSQLNGGKKWLSTAGLGVHWLHVRIDSRPKYYRYREYKK